MSNSEDSDVVATNDNKIEEEVVFMDKRYDSIISINRNQLEKLSSDREDVPNDFFTTHVQLIFWEEEKNGWNTHRLQSI